MLKIRWFKKHHVVRTINAKWTINISEIARYADELQPHCDADDWEIVNESDIKIFSKARWLELK